MIPELDVFGTDPYWLLTGGAMSLDEAVERALKNNTDLAVERFRPESAAESVRAAIRRVVGAPRRIRFHDDGMVERLPA